MYADFLFKTPIKKENFNNTILEKSKYALAHRVDTSFLDLGTYKSLLGFLKNKDFQDSHNKNTLIYATSREVKSFGMQDAIIIESDEGVLVFHRDYIDKIDQLLK